VLRIEMLEAAICGYASATGLARYARGDQYQRIRI